MSTVHIGIEVPRSPQTLPDGTVRSNGEWQAGPHQLLPRWLRIAAQVTDPGHIRLLSGAPDQAVYDLMDLFPGVVETGLADWVGMMADRAAEAHPDDVVVLIRGASVLASPQPILNAIGVLRASARMLRVEPAVMPGSLPLAGMVALHGGKALPFFGIAGIDPAEFQGYALPCPVFEVTRLSAFRPGAGLIGRSAPAGFVLVGEDEAVLLESHLDLCRATTICDQHPLPE